MTDAFATYKTNSYMQSGIDFMQSNVRIKNYLHVQENLIKKIYSLAVVELTLLMTGIAF
jgi:hypothetical protein